MKTVKQVCLTTDQVIQILINSGHNQFVIELTQEEDTLSYIDERRNSKGMRTMRMSTDRSFTFDLQCSISRLEYTDNGKNIIVEGVELNYTDIF